MLQVWLRAPHSPLAVWQADSKKWQTVSSWQQLYDDYSQDKDKTICLYFPSSHLLQVETELSTAQLKQLGDTGKQYLFEETSLSPIEQLVIRQASHVNIHYLYALANNDIESWVQSAALVGMSVGALLPDFLLLSIPEEGAGQQVVLYQDEYTALLRQSQLQGLAVSYLPLILDRLPHLSEVCLLQSIPSSDTSADSDSSSMSDMMAQTDALLAEQQILLTPLTDLPVPLETPERHALNFFTRRSDTQLSPYLRAAIIVALSALVLQIATDGLQLYRYNAAAHAVQTATAAQYQAWFPNETLNTSRTKLSVQMQPKLKSDSQESASHLAVLARISPLIKQSSLHAQSLAIEPTALSFTLIAPDRDSLDQFARTLTTQGIAASLDRVNNSEQGQFSGQITVNIADADTAADAGGVGEST